MEHGGTKIIANLTCTMRRLVGGLLAIVYPIVMVITQPGNCLYAHKEVTQV